MSKAYCFLKDIDTSHVAVDRRDAWMPKGDVAYFDKAAQRTFHSRAEKRAWLISQGMRESGDSLKVRGRRDIQGQEKRQLSPAVQSQRAQVARQIEQAGGVTKFREQLLRRNHVR